MEEVVGEWVWLGLKECCFFLNQGSNIGCGVGSSWLVKGLKGHSSTSIEKGQGEGKGKLGG